QPPEGVGQGEALVTAESMGEPLTRQAPGTEPVVRPQSEGVQSLSPQREFGSAMDVPLRRRDAELPAAVDRSTPMATSGTIPEAGHHAAGSPGGYPELLPDQSS